MILRTKSIFLFLCLLFISCRKDETKIEADLLIGDKQILIGTWVWLYSEHNHGWCDGLSFVDTLTPQSNSNAYSLMFEEKGRVELFKNQDIISINGIYFNYFTIEEDGGFNFNIYLNNDKNNSLGGVGNDTMMRVFFFPFLEETGCEIYQNYFVKQ